MDNLNSVCHLLPKIINSPIMSKTIQSNVNKDTVKDDIQKLYADSCNFSLQDYQVYFYNSQYEMYNDIILTIINAYKNTIGRPHIVCSNMELSPLDEQIILHNDSINKPTTKPTTKPSTKPTTKTTTKTTTKPTTKTTTKPTTKQTSTQMKSTIEYKSLKKSTSTPKTIKDILNYYSEQGIVDVTYAIPNVYGATNKSEIEKSIADNTCLIIVPFVNYMVGSINNIKAIGELAHEYKIPLLSNCGYVFGKQHINPSINNIDIFTTDLCVTTSLLAIKKDLVDGYKLQLYSTNLQDIPKELSITAYNYIRQILMECKKRMNNLESNNGKISELKSYLISLLGKKKTIYYYDSVIKDKIQNKPGDIIILGPNMVEVGRVLPHVISFIYLGKIKSKSICVYSNGNTQLFYNMGITKKYLSKIITLSLESCSKKDIKDFVDLL